MSGRVKTARGGSAPALMLFAIAYLGTLGIVVAPAGWLRAGPAPVVQGAVDVLRP